MDSKHVTAAKPKIGGAIHVAPVGTVLPTDAASPLGSEFKDLGYISDAGVTNSNSMSTESTKAWGGSIVLDTQTEKTDTFKFVLLEATNVEVLKYVYGDKNVTGSLENGITIDANSEEQEERAIVIDMILKGGILKRLCIPRGKIVEVDEIVYNDKDPVAYGTKVSAAVDNNGSTHKEYLVKPAADSGTTDQTEQEDTDETG